MAASKKMGEKADDHRSFVASLTGEERQHLTAKSNAIGLAHFAVHLGAIIFVGALIAARVPAWPLLLIFQGVLIIFLFTLMHEVIHRTAFASGKLNDTVAWFCGLLILLPPAWFRYFHFAHHRHTQDPEKDPELAAPKPKTVKEYVVHITGIPVWIGQLKALFRNAFVDSEDAYVPAAGRPKVKREARIMLAIYAGVLIGSLVANSAHLLWVWLVPILLGQPFLRLYLLAEHGLCPFVANMFENTRTTYTNTIVRHLAWNMPFHTEHHAYPTVPFHKLLELNTIMRDELRVTEDGYGRFNKDYVEQLQ